MTVNIGKQALAILTTVAPTIATALGGPVAGLAVQKLEQFFGVKGDAELDAAVAGATPDQMLALKKLDNDFKVQMAQIGFQEDQLVYGDIASARQREVAVKDWIPAALAIGITVGFFGILAFMLVYGVRKEAGGDALLVLLGSLGTAWTAVVSYYFGSSLGARKSAEALATIAKQP
jgi:hypothetical protein